MEVDHQVIHLVSQEYHQETVKLCLVEEEESLVEKYLSESAFFDFRTSGKVQQDSHEAGPQKLEDVSKHLQSQSKKQMNPTKNSIFHNFQKHLITIIKKLVNIGEMTFYGYGNHKLAFNLWKTFLASRGTSKKVFQITFGVSNTTRREEELIKLGEMFPEFKVLLAQHPIEDIEYAQELIRREVASQTRRLNKEDILARCRVHKWEQFYQYFTAFMQDLFQGQITSRISKIQKQKLIVRLYSGSKMA